jgi:hypothetical protein
MGLAGTWAAGALSSGPLPLNITKDRDGTWRRPVVMPVLTGAGAFGLFCGAAQLARHIPPLNRAIGSVLHYADDGSTPLVLAAASPDAAGSALSFQPRPTLVDFVRRTEGLALCGRGAACPG